MNLPRRGFCWRKYSAPPEPKHRVSPTLDSKTTQKQSILVLLLLYAKIWYAAAQLTVSREMLRCFLRRQTSAPILGALNDIASSSLDKASDICSIRGKKSLLSSLALSALGSGQPDCLRETCLPQSSRKKGKDTASSYKTAASCLEGQNGTHNSKAPALESQLKQLDDVPAVQKRNGQEIWEVDCSHQLLEISALRS